MELFPIFSSHVSDPVPSPRCHWAYDSSTKEVCETDNQPKGYEADHIIALEDIVHIYRDGFSNTRRTGIPTWLRDVSDIANSSSNLCWIPSRMNDQKEKDEAKSAPVQTYLIRTQVLWLNVLQEICEVNMSFGEDLYAHFMEKHGLVPLA